MPSTTCKSCGRSMSARVAVCPHCGAQNTDAPRIRIAESGQAGNRQPPGSFKGDLVAAALLMGVGLGVHAEMQGWYEEPNRGYLITGVCLALMILLRLWRWSQDRKQA